MDAVLCPKCFYRIVDITKPCAHCGCSVEEINAAIKRREEEEHKRQEEEQRKREEQLRKQEEQKQLLIKESMAILCPNCKSLITNVKNKCPNCGCSEKELAKEARCLIVNNKGEIVGKKLLNEILEIQLEDGKAIKCPECHSILNYISKPCPNCSCPPDRLRQIAKEKLLNYSDDGLLTGKKTAEEIKLLEEEERRKEEEKRKEFERKQEERKIEQEKKEYEATSNLEKLGDELLNKYYSEPSPSRAVLYQSSPSAFKGAINMMGGNRGGYGITMMPKVWVLRSHVGQEYFIPVSSIAYVLVYAHQGFMDIATTGAGFDSKTRNQATNPTFNVAISNSDVDRIKKAVKYCMSINNSDIDIQER